MENIKKFVYPVNIYFSLFWPQTYCQASISTFALRVARCGFSYTTSPISYTRLSASPSSLERLIYICMQHNSVFSCEPQEHNYYACLLHK